MIGDSISMGYTRFVRRCLKKSKNVSRPEGKCGLAERGVTGWINGLVIKNNIK